LPEASDVDQSASAGGDQGCKGSPRSKINKITTGNPPLGC
jgi:hypothetical protein